MADFQDVADNFRQLVEDIRQDPAQLLERGEVDRFKEIAIHAVARTNEQKKFARGLGEELFIAKRVDLVDRQRTLNAKLRTDLSDTAEESARAELEVLESLVQSNDRALDSIEAQTNEYGLSIGNVVRLSEFEQRRAEIAAEIAEIKMSMVGLSAESLKLQQDRVDSLRDENQLAKLQHAEGIKNSAVAASRAKQEEIFGFSVEGVNDKIKEMGVLLSTTGGTIALLAIALKVVLGPLIKQMQELRDIGLTWRQTWEATGNIVQSMVDRGLVRGLLTLKSTAEVTAAMRGNFADITFQTHELVALGGELVTSFKLSSDESAQLLEVLAKVGGFTADSTENILHMAQAFGQVNKIRPGALLQAAARHASVFARFGEQGAQAFFRSVIAAERLGIELSAIESTADAFLDIDSFFQNVSKLRTLGIDIADPFGLAQIAERGTPQELLAELQRQMRGVDLTTLGRTRRNALASAIGMDVADLSRLIQGQDVGAVGDVTGAQIDEFGGFAEGMGGAVDAMAEMVGALGGIDGSLKIIIGLLILNQLGAGKILGGISRVLGVGRAAAAGVSIPGGIAGAAGAAGTAASFLGVGAAGLAGGLAIGEGINRFGESLGFEGSRSFATVRAERQSARVSEASGAAEDRRRSRVIADRMAREEIVRSGMPGATADELAKAFRSVRVDMDGRTVGNLTYRASHPSVQR